MKSFAAHCLGFKEEYLKAVNVSLIPPALEKKFIRHSIPSFCYSNAFKCASMVDGVVVFGAAVVDFGGAKIPMEHAWLLVDGEYYDPTYQYNDNEFNTEYFSLAELTISEYLGFIERFYPDLINIKEIDFYVMRKHSEFHHLFGRERKKESA